MADVLVIVESPAKAKTIGRLLGKKFTVKSSLGHVRDLPKSQIGVDITNGFQPRYITIRGKGEVLKELRDAAKKARQVLLASDPDREGEAIAWHLQEILGIGNEERCRIEFNEITKQAIQEAVQHPRPIDRDRVEAQQARRVLDRLVGYNLSPLLWRKVKKGLSAGRVQSVAVRLICDREREVSEFVPEEYWTLTASFGTRPPFEARLAKRGQETIKPGSKEEMDAILAELRGQDFRMAGLSRKDKKRYPPPPFITSALQQEAYRRLNFTARRTMSVAQQLYEGVDLGQHGRIGLISYIRTDSPRVAAVAQEEARQVIAERFGKEYLPEKPPHYAGRKQAQDAHEAIRPTSSRRSPEEVKAFLSADQIKLYRLIWERFLSSQMQPALLEVTAVEIAAGAYLFHATGTLLKFPGFLAVYAGEEEESAGEGSLLPNLEKGQVLPLKKLVPAQHFTQPPPRYTEATLVKTLEELGIGRPSTYAPTIETILSRGYVVREKKQFLPTELGMVVVDLLKEHFQEIIDVDFTANMESKLDMVEEGELYWKEVVAGFYGPFAQVLQKAEQEIGEVEIKEELSEEVCEKCGRHMVVKMGRFGKFLACPGFPECRNTKPLLEKVGVPCPRCGGDVVVRRTKKGRPFYGCANYPTCAYLSWDRPAGEPCPRCGEMLVEKSGKGGKRLSCPRQGCGYSTGQPRGGGGRKTGEG